MPGIARTQGVGETRGATSWFASLLVLLAVVLVVIGSQGPVYALGSVLAAGLVTAVLVFGATRVGITILMACFVTAPAYKGLAGGGGGTVTPTDALMVMGFGLLLPQILSGALRLPIAFVTGGVVVLFSGLIATIGSASPVVSALGVTFWMVMILGVPIAVLLWRPSSRIIRLLAWSYVAGQVLSWVLGRALGHVTGGRDYGLTQHPNYFAEGGLMAVALLIYLFFAYSSWRPRAVVLFFGVICAASVFASGSRAAPVVLAVLIVMIPFVERSAIAGFVWAVGGAAMVGLSPFILNLAGQTASVSRLLGNGTAAGSDQQREQGLQTGLQMVRERPIFGRGLVSTDLFNIHNNYVEVAVAVGVVGLIGYVLVLFNFARPLFDDHEHRRLCYMAWAYIGWGTTVPALYDRSIWLPLALAAVCWLRQPPAGDDAIVRQPNTDAVGRPLASPGRA